MTQALLHDSPFLDEQQRHLRRNIAAYMTDWSGFGAAIGFINPTTVLPVLVRQLTSSALLVGLLTTVWTGGWLLPQLPAGRWLCERPRKKTYMVWLAGLGRLAMPALAALFFLAGPSDAIVLLMGLFGGVLIFRATDSIASVAWYDILSKAIPASRRGRVIGIGQTSGGLMALGAAVIVRWALSSAGPTFPLNFALLFGLASAGLFISLLGLIALVEPAELVENSASQQMSFVAHARHVVYSDRAFRMVTAVRLLSGLAGIAIPFYVVHATRELGLPPSFVGLAVGTQNVAGIISSFALGALAERRGSVRVIQASAAMAFLAPLMALTLHALGAVQATLISGGYLIVFAALSAVDGSILLGYLNYVMEIAPPGERPAYLGLSNTISGVLVVLPIVGGALLQATSYTALFLVAALGAGSGLLLSMRLSSSETE